MNNSPTKRFTREETDAMIRSAGVRITRQRRAVLDVILQSTDHPTAQVIFQRAAEKTRGLSLATVYNCLETLSSAQVINQLNLDAGPARFCGNVVKHAHFIDLSTETVYDVHLKPGICPEDVFDLPEGVTISQMDVYMQGIMPSKKEESPHIA